VAWRDVCCAELRSTGSTSAQARALLSSAALPGLMSSRTLKRRRSSPSRSLTAKTGSQSRRVECVVACSRILHFRFRNFNDSVSLRLRNPSLRLLGNGCSSTHSREFECVARPNRVHCSVVVCCVIDCVTGIED
jgi:hypothetical protein